VLIECQDDGVAEALKALAGVAQVEVLHGGRYRAYPSDRQSIVTEVADLIKQQSWSTSRLSVEQPRLDEVFRDITRAKDKDGTHGEAA
jgi:ferric-dicitrate binding protein FerR (iron transport regulator)